MTKTTRLLRLLLLMTSFATVASLVGCPEVPPDDDDTAAADDDDSAA